MEGGTGFTFPERPTLQNHLRATLAQYWTGPHSIQELTKLKGENILFSQCIRFPSQCEVLMMVLKVIDALVSGYLRACILHYDPA